jgi:mannose-6-phosphate isomerase
MFIDSRIGVNSYDWGKVGKDSAAAKYAAATPSDEFSIAEDKPYAEVRENCDIH